MQGKTRTRDRHLRRLEQIASLTTSIVWTAIVLVVLVIVWGYQDAKAQWQSLENDARSQALHDSVSSLHGVTEGNATNGPATYLNAESTPWVIEDGAPQVLPETPLDQLTAQSIRPTFMPPTVTAYPALDATPATAVTREATVTKTPTLVPTLTPSPSPTPTPEPTLVTAVSASVGVPDRLVIKSVGIDTAVLPMRWTTVEQGGQEYSMWEVADYVAGWHATSALAGQPGNTVLAGHHNIKGEVFRYLVDVQEGDEVDLFAGDTLYKFIVEQKLIVREKGESLEVRQRNAQWIAPTNDVRLTLVTCWPYTNNTHRVIVVAKPSP